MAATALITGASSGIGADLARIHAEKGGALVLVARRKDRLDGLKSELEKTNGTNVAVLAEDLADPGAISRIHKAVHAAGIEVDCLINNAGFGGRGLFHEMPWEQALAMIQVNSVALAGLTRAFLPEFVARDSGRILNITSTASEVPGPLQAVYFATKAFSASLSNALAEEVRGSKVTVTNFMPTATRTEFADVAGMANTPLFQRAATSRTVAEQGYAAMMRGDLDAYGGMNAQRWIAQKLLSAMPKRWALAAVRRVQEAS